MNGFMGASGNMFAHKEEKNLLAKSGDAVSKGAADTGKAITGGAKATGKALTNGASAVGNFFMSPFKSAPKSD